MNRAAEFDRLFDEHRQAIHGYLLGRTGDADLAADLLQETYLRVWRKLELVLQAPECERRFYILSVARSVTADNFRRRRTELPLNEVTMAAPASEGAELGMIDQAIARLPEDLRTVLVMHVLGGMSSGEVGKALNRPAGTVRYQLHEARRRLAVMLGVEER